MGLVPETLVIFNAASRRGDALAAQLQPHAAGGDGLRWVSLAELDGLNAQPERVVAVGGDGTVNAADYTVWQDGLGGAYTVADYGIWKGNFGATSATGSSIAVPEPAALLLCCGLVGVVLGIRQTRVK